VPMRVVLVLLVIGVSVVMGQISTYDRLYRTFLMFDVMPLNVSAARSGGWTSFTNCDPKLGIAYSSVSGGPTEFSPGFLYFTSAGQISGFGARIWSEYVPQNLVPRFWKPVAGVPGAYDLSISFRKASTMCSGSTNKEVLGDQVSINNDYLIPENSDIATAAGWVMGDCISQMGIHYSFDLNAQHGKMTWNSSSLLPIMPMYGVNDKQIKAVLIATPTYQYTFPLGEFEGPFTNGLFCFNWCPNTGCTFSGTSVWTTFHWLFTNYAEVSCTGAPCAFN